MFQQIENLHTLGPIVVAQKVVGRRGGGGGGRGGAGGGRGEENLVLDA